ncbi:enolase C-terminal domain-like protein [Terriglobus aquaticus]|uniref:Enolase C-terminal domain-like protein n=1 Tax=Terriglobus aquaticus TaxID=940139 RepID=A0ABW9KP81_9BACT|nr:enolase C-terminal domain-like protein [Terriglobus aquaticus]
MKITGGTATSYTVPTDAPEADGTFAWNSTTLIVVELKAGNATGLGYTYSHSVIAALCRDMIQKIVAGSDVWQSADLFHRMRVSQRNYGREGIGATALSAIDVAVWDLKAKLLQKPLVALLGQAHDAAPVYGSGGFTAYNDEQLTAQLAGWVAQGIPRVKMKIGTHPDDDLRRVALARKAIGNHAELFVDANGAYSRKQALDFAHRFRHEYGVTWFEEPVSSDDLRGLRLLRDNGPDGLDIAAGEYGWNDMTLRAMLDAEAVDVLQADATRCGGVTGFMAASALAEAHPLPLSAHCAPSLHLHLACASRPLRHVEYFHDHARIERMLFDGFREPVNGAMLPDLTRPGMGLEFKRQDAESFRDDI